MNNPGKFIVVEGPDGSGKTTLTSGLLNQLPDSVLFREPTNNSPFSEKLRNVLSGKDNLNETEIRNLFMNDRIWDLENNINPSILVNKFTILDRYYYSTAAYQGKDDSDINNFINENLNSNEIRQPDVIFYLKIDFETAMRRVSLRNKNLEIFEKKEELKRIIKNYDYIFSNFHFPSSLFILDANARPEELTEFAVRKVSIVE